MDHGLSSKIPSTDDRQESWKKQREERGFDDTELWNLDIAIAKFILPRLIAFRDIANGAFTPGNLKNEEWIKILNKIIFSFEYISSGSQFKFNEGAGAQATKGMKLFAKYYNALWL